MATKTHVKKGDTVRIISGAEKGATGKILALTNGGQRAVVEGINKCTKHMKKSQDNPEGAIVQKELPIHISNLMATDSAED